MRYELRAVTERDHAFLYALHEQAMRSYVEQTWGWDDADQRARFRVDFEAIPRKIVVSDGVDVGVIGVVRSEDDLHLDLIEIAPAWQGRGLGTLLLRELIAEAEARGVPVTLQVLKVNPARRLYERLGLAPTGETPTLHLMRRG